MADPAGLPEVFRAQSNVLIAQSQAAAALRHRGTKGTERERVLESFLTPLLPLRLGIGRGEIRAATGGWSSQEDLIVYDALNCPRLFVGAGAQVFPVESVAAVIEVKSRLSSADIASASANIARARSLPKIGQSSQLTSSSLTFRPPSSILGVLFSFELGMSETGFRNAWVQHQDGLPPDKRINLVCVLNRFTMSYVDCVFHLWDAASEDHLGKYFASRAGPDSLLSFTLALLRVVSETSFATPDLFGHVFSGPTSFLEFPSMFSDPFVIDGV